MEESINLPAKVVVDASVILALLLPDEKIKPKAVDTLQLYSRKKVNFFSTDLLDFEVLNGLKAAVLSKRINQKTAKELVKNFFQLKIQKEAVNFKRAFDYSLQFSVSVYDAGYLALAQKKGLSLMTIDKKLYQKAKKKFKLIFLLTSAS